MPAPAATSPLEAIQRSGRGRAKYIWLLGIGVYLFFLFFAGTENLRDALGAINPLYLLPLIAIEGAVLWFRVAKWYFVFDFSHRTTAMCMMSKAAGNLTPARIGEFSPLLTERFRSAKVGAWIIFDRLLEAASTLMLGAAGLIAVMGITQGYRLLGWILLLIIAIFSGLYVLSRRSWLDSATARFASASKGRSAREKLLAVSDETAQLGSKAPLLLAMSLVATGMDLAIGYLLYLSFGFPVAFTVLALAQCVHALASVVPLTPNATGVPYIAAAALLHQIADVPVEVLTLAVGIRMLAVNAIFWPSVAFGLRSANEKDDFANQGDLFDHLASGDTLYAYPPESLEKINALLPRDGILLDVGCGDGFIAQALRSDRVIGIDISPRCVHLCRGRGVEGVVGDATRNIPFADSSFDTVACIDVLHHLDQQWDTIFPELDRILKPGGTLCIVEPDARNPFVRWTQAPGSPIRVAPWPNEPAINPVELIPHLENLGYRFDVNPIHIAGSQQERSVFPLWQRLLKAPFVLIAYALYRNRPNKFSIVAEKPHDRT